MGSSGYGSEVLQDFLCARALNRQLRIARAGVFDLCVKFVVGDDVREVGVLVAGIDAQQVVRVGDFVDEQVVNESAARGHQAGIMGLADGELRGVVAADPLDEWQRAGTANFDFAHVAHVEEAGTRAHRFVLGEDAGVLQGHVPAAEIDHLGAEAAVDGIQGCFAQFDGGRRVHRGFLMKVVKH